MNNILRIDTGIDTFEVSILGLHYSQVQRVCDHLESLDRKYHTGGKRNKDSLNPSYLSRFYASRGVNIVRTYQASDYNNGGISLAINPSTLRTKKFQPTKLYNPSKEAYCVDEAILSFLKEIHLEDYYDNIITRERLFVSQIDVTQNLWFDDGTDLETIIGLFRKSNVPYDLNRNKKIPGFCVNANIVTVKTYDKIPDLQHSGLLPPKLEKKLVLRLEVSMKREKFIKAVGLNRQFSVDQMLDKPESVKLAVLQTPGNPHGY